LLFKRDVFLERFFLLDFWREFSRIDLDKVIEVVHADFHSFIKSFAGLNSQGQQLASHLFFLFFEKLDLRDDRLVFLLFSGVDFFRDKLIFCSFDAFLLFIGSNTLLLHVLNKLSWYFCEGLFGKVDLSQRSSLLSEILFKIYYVYHISFAL
jgi:hypothetical protein